MFCPNCGSKAIEENKFCTSCGSPNPHHKTAPPATEQLTQRFAELLSSGGTEADFAKLEQDMMANIQQNLQKINENATGNPTPELLKVQPKVAIHEQEVSDALHKFTEQYLRDEGHIGELTISPLGFPAMGGMPIFAAIDKGVIFLLNTWSARHIEKTRSEHTENTTQALIDLQNHMENSEVTYMTDLKGYALGLAHAFAIPNLTQEEYEMSWKCYKILLESKSLNEPLLIILLLAEAFARRKQPEAWQDLIDGYEVFLNKTSSILTNPQMKTSVIRGVIFYLLSIQGKYPPDFTVKFEELKTNYF